MKLLSPFKNRLFRIFFIFLLIVIGVSVYQNWSIPRCGDCNLVIISVDTLRPDHMGVYGYDKNTTPNIDAWARNAVVFTNVRTTVPTTYPSFATLMTGVSVFKTLAFDNSVTDDGESPNHIPLPKTIATLAQTLKKNGFTTAAFLNTVSLDKNLTSLDRGFDLFDNVYGTQTYTMVDKNLYKSYNNVKKADSWIVNNKSKRFFVWVHLMEPHAPYFPISQFKCKFDSKYCYEIDKKGLQELENERLDLKECQLNGLPRDRIELYQTLYNGAISTMDQLVKNVFSTLQKTGLNKKTVVLLYGDHGEGFDHNFYFMHTHELYDSHIKIPVIIKYPLNLSGKRIDDNYYSNTQIFPTLLDLLDVPFTRASYSNSLVNSFHLSIFELSNFRQPDTFFINSDLSKYAILSGNYKYIYSLKERSCLFRNQDQELYDLNTDPGEVINLIKEKPTIAKALRSKLLKYLATYNLPNSAEALGLTQKSSSSSAEEKGETHELKTLGY